MPKHTRHQPKKTSASIGTDDGDDIAAAEDEPPSLVLQLQVTVALMRESLSLQEVELVELKEQQHAEISRGCALIPNVYLAHHPTLGPNNLYDHIHLHKQAVEIFTDTLKDPGGDTHTLDISPSPAPQDTTRPINTHSRLKAPPLMPASPLPDQHQAPKEQHCNPAMPTS
ncbi:hypothetical protein SKAU_G00276170 [Synaphobranchus kaupii]|uniref:Uncharacterized protein n=1 Tax=Synaphobranchus kaupii TaxID=118154 RepID=A0A9Q1F1B7_SYNKA|nr:hypothetical protein SKAU_G00276170 [Synaphobranchus kaupii]